MCCHTCYCCPAPATTVEHVPPRCLFPEKKDAFLGKDHRRSLITVPACDAHNLSKSKDDEYLLCILAVVLQNNDVGRRQGITKVMRALKRSPGLAKRVFVNHKPILVFERRLHQPAETVAIELDVARLNRCLEQIALALYYHETGTAWTGRAKAHPEFTFGHPEYDRKLQALTHKLDQIAPVLPAKGSNPEVFKYYFAHDPAQPHRCGFRLVFYGGTKAVVTLMPSTDPLFAPE